MPGDRLEAYATLPGAAMTPKGAFAKRSISILLVFPGERAIPRWSAGALGDRLEAYAALPGAAMTPKGAFAKRSISILLVFPGEPAIPPLERSRTETGWKPMLRCRAPP